MRPCQLKLCGVVPEIPFAVCRWKGVLTNSAYLFILLLKQF